MLQYFWNSVHRLSSSRAAYMAYVSSLSTMLNKICFTLEIVQPESLCILLMEGSKNISLDTVETLPSDAGEFVYSCNSQDFWNREQRLAVKDYCLKRTWSASVQINPLQPPPFLLFLGRWLPKLGRDPKDSFKWVSWAQRINFNTPLSPVKLYQGSHPALDPQKCPAVPHVRCAGLSPPK